jgi:hypothetical protein
MPSMSEKLFLRELRAVAMSEAERAGLLLTESALKLLTRIPSNVEFPMDIDPKRLRNTIAGIFFRAGRTEQNAVHAERLQSLLSSKTTCHYLWFC